MPDEILFSYTDPTTPLLHRKIIRAIEVGAGGRKLETMYRGWRAEPASGESFWQAAVERLAIDVRYDAAALAAIPRAGPLVVVANHPFGVLDGIVISWLIEKVRADFKVLTNAVLLKAPEVRPSVLAIDFAPTQAARETNLASRAAARAQLEGGGCLVVFPAGGVSTSPDRLGRLPAVDAPWQLFTAQLIQRTRAGVVPVRFFGQNSRLFQMASHVSQTLRLSLIFREVRRRMKRPLLVAIGAPIPFEEIAGTKNRQELLGVLRERTYGLPPP